jgi:phosphoesterase RecJ-like protein
LAPAINRESSVTEVADAFRAARRVTAICHENPDADTIGAAIAVYLVAEKLGADAEIVSVDTPAPMFRFLPRIEQFRRRPGLTPDLAVICDAATLERVGRLATDESEWLARARVVNVDHHATSDYFGDLNLVDATAAATCQVLARLVPELEVDLDEDLATALLTGIVRDSHGFAEPSTSAETLRLSALLVEAGAPLAQIHRAILGEMTYVTMMLWGRILATIGRDSSGRILHASLTQEMLEQTGTQQHDADGVVEFLARVNGADVTLLFRELAGGATRVSVRTTSAVDAVAIARRFEGGGHVRRAGFVVSAPISQARNDVIRLCSAQFADA